MKLDRLVWVAVAVILVAIGCGKQTKPAANPASASKPAVAGVAKPVAVDPATLPELEEGPPPVDAGRLEVSKPKEWVLMPRSTKYLVGFQQQVGVSYPSITIVGKDRSEPGTVTHENLSDFARQVHEEQQAELDKTGHKLTTPVVPIQIGEFAGAEVFRTGQVGGYISLERTLLVTILEGREYTLELRTSAGETAKYRPFALAVASGLRPVSANRAAASETPKNP